MIMVQVLFWSKFATSSVATSSKGFVNSWHVSKHFGFRQPAFRLKFQTESPYLHEIQPWLAHAYLLFCGTRGNPLNVNGRAGCTASSRVTAVHRDRDFVTAAVTAFSCWDATHDDDAGCRGILQQVWCVLSPWRCPYYWLERGKKIQNSPTDFKKHWWFTAYKAKLHSRLESSKLKSSWKIQGLWLGRCWWRVGTLATPLSQATPLGPKQVSCLN